jgi:hypothetical protein
MNENHIKIRPEYRIPLTRAIARHWGMGVSVELTCLYTDRGWCYGGSLIKLPRPAVGCCLETILHELAHAYEHQIKRRKSHHNKDFKNSLSLLTHHTRPFYRKILLEVKEQVAQDTAEQRRKAQQVLERTLRESVKREEVKAFKASRGYKMERLQARIKKLESRQKRLNTLIKSGKRSLSTYERLECARTNPGAPSAILQLSHSRPAAGG